MEGVRTCQRTGCPGRFGMDAKEACRQMSVPLRMMPKKRVKGQDVRRAASAWMPKKRVKGQDVRCAASAWMPKKRSMMYMRLMDEYKNIACCTKGHGSLQREGTGIMRHLFTKIIVVFLLAVPLGVTNAQINPSQQQIQNATMEVVQSLKESVQRLRVQLQG